MKSIITKVCSWLINQGADKWLHFLFGLLIAELMMLIKMPIVPRLSASMAVVVVVEAFKESVVDSFFNKIDLLYTVIGGLLGVGLSCLTLMI